MKLHDWRNAVLFGVLLYLGACGNKESEPAPPAPTAVTVRYVETLGLHFEEEMTPLAPITTGSPTQFSVSPALPAGLALNTQTGVISGAPGTLLEPSTFTITARNASSSATAALELVISPHEEGASNGTMALASPDNTQFVSGNSNVVFTVSGATLSSAPGEIQVFRNEEPLAASVVQVSGNNLTLVGALQDGLNDFVVLARDTQGRSLGALATLWAGTNTLSVSVLNPLGQPAAGPITVTAQLSDDPSVSRQIISAQNVAQFTSIPSRTILLKATTADNQSASLATTGGAGNATLTLQGFGLPSVMNHSFGLGSSGWIPQLPESISLIAHEEAAGPQSKASDIPASADKALRIKALSASRKFTMDRARLAKNAGAAPPVVSFIAGDDMDLQLSTVGEGARRVSYPFTIAPGTGSVKVRYRFVTSEYPEYYGSEYNDGFSIELRSRDGSGQASVSNSMNGLGASAFSAGGSTAWRTLELPVSVAGDTVQIDATVSNVGDGALDSLVIIDFVTESNLAISVDRAVACPNQTVTFTAQGGAASSTSWSGGGAPASATGSTFVTRFPTPGTYTVSAASSGGAPLTKTVEVWSAIGPAWHPRFPTSVSLADLTDPFRTNATNFLSALNAAGVQETISATYRPPERAYLMHYSWKMAAQDLNPASVPAMSGVNVCWQHYNSSGQPDPTAAKQAATTLALGARYYNITAAIGAALASRHTAGRAMDISAAWAAPITIKNASNADVVVPAGSAGTSSALWAAGATYGVIKKQVGDRPHWSDTGS